MPTVSAIISEALHLRLRNWKLRTRHSSTSESVKILVEVGLDVEKSNLVEAATKVRDELTEAFRKREIQEWAIRRETMIAFGDALEAMGVDDA